MNKHVLCCFILKCTVNKKFANPLFVTIYVRKQLGSEGQVKTKDIKCTYSNQDLLKHERKASLLH